MKNEDLRCPVCLEDFAHVGGYPRQCSEGHVLCAPCFAAITPASVTVACPVCRVAMPRPAFGRNLILEKLLDVREVPCRHGCGALCKGRAASSAHSARCAMRSVLCAACSRTMPWDELWLRHVPAEHLASEVCLALPRIRVDASWGPIRRCALAGARFFVCFLLRVRLEGPLLRLEYTVVSREPEERLCLRAAVVCGGAELEAHSQDCPVACEQTREAVFYLAAEPPLGGQVRISLAQRSA